MIEHIMNASTRLRFTAYAALFLAGVTILSILRGMEAVAATSVAGLMTILSTYIWSQTKRPHYEDPGQNHPDDGNGHTRHPHDDGLEAQP
jgi:hypothetical protein